MTGHFFGRYDDRLEELVSYERIALTDLERIEIGEFMFCTIKYSNLKIFNT